MASDLRFLFEDHEFRIGMTAQKLQPSGESNDAGSDDDNTRT
jgi:hypothetical protein